MKLKELKRLVRNGMVLSLDKKSVVELCRLRRNSSLVSVCIGLRGVCGCLRRDYETKELYATTTRKTSKIFC